MQYGIRPQRRRPPGRARLIIGIIIAIAVIAGIIIFFWASSGNNGSVVPASSRTDHAAAPIADKTYSGQYMTFRYKGGYVLKPLTAQPPDLELADLVAATTYDKQVAVSVDPLPDGGLSAIGAYNFRSVYTNLYSQRQVPVGTDTAIIWVKNDGSEQTVFIPHGTKVAMLSFSVTGTNDPGDLTAEVNSLLASFRWK